MFIRPIIGSDITALKVLFNSCSLFHRASIDFSMYYFSFRPKHSYIVTSKCGHLAHGSIKRWTSRYPSIPSILMLGLIYVRTDYRKFGIGELITNYLLKIYSNEMNLIHANICSEHLPFYIRYGFQCSFSLISFQGKLSEFFEVSSKKNDEIVIQSIESCDILDLASYDSQIYPSYRIEYFEQLREHSLSVAGYVAYSKESKEIVGYIVLNFSDESIKCGPLYAETSSIAVLLLRQCAMDYDGTMILTLPEENRTAMKLFESKLFQRKDILHRVYKGHEEIFGKKTIFERIWSITDDWLSLI